MAITVRFQPTPNPNAGKFVVGGAVIADDRSQSFDSPADAVDASLPAALIDLPDVTNVFMVEDFITITKRPDADWDELIPEVERRIRENA